MADKIPLRTENSIGYTESGVVVQTGPSLAEAMQKIKKDLHSPPEKLPWMPPLSADNIRRGLVKQPGQHSG